MPSSRSPVSIDTVFGSMPTFFMLPLMVAVRSPAFMVMPSTSTLHVISAAPRATVPRTRPKRVAREHLDRRVSGSHVICVEPRARRAPIPDELACDARAELRVELRVEGVRARGERPTHVVGHDPALADEDRLVERTALVYAHGETI